MRKKVIESESGLPYDKVNEFELRENAKELDTSDVFVPCLWNINAIC